MTSPATPGERPLAVSLGVRGACPIPSKASSYVEKLGKRFFAHRYFVENLAARFAMVAQAGGAIFASFAVLGLLASLAHRKFIASFHPLHVGNELHPLGVWNELLPVYT